MKFVFQSDFADSGAMASWYREQHTPDGYPDFTIENNALILWDAGNRILPHIPTIKNFVMEGSFAVHWEGAENQFSFTIHFDYDPHCRKGESLEIACDGKELHLYRNQKEVTAENGKNILKKILRQRKAVFVLERKNRSLLLHLNGTVCYQEKCNPGSGKIALERGHFGWYMRLEDFTLTADAPKPVKKKHFKIPFSHINGMPDVIWWEMDVVQIGDCMRLDTTLSGGVTDRPHLPWFPYHGSYSEMLEAPYFRINTKDGREILLELTPENLSLKNKPGHFSYMPGIGDKKPQWPFHRSFFTECFDPETILLTCGYQYYVNRIIAKHLAGGPSETIFDAAKDQIIYTGMALTDGKINGDLYSQTAKKLLRKIPAKHPLRQRALDFAQRNHFFCEGEDCKFHFRFTKAGPFLLEDLHLEYTLSNVFFDAIRKPVKLQWKKEQEIAPGIFAVDSEEFVLKKLPAGVYHIQFVCKDGCRTILDDFRAFEVMTDSQSGPQASNLPRLYSTPSEVMGVDTNEFDPFLRTVSDIAHYMDTAAGIMPHIAEEQKVWELYKVYHRDWHLWYTTRTVENLDLQLHKDSVGNCDFIAMGTEWQKKCLVRVCGRAFYTGPQMEIFAQFAKERNFHAKEICESLKKQEIPSLAVFQDLVDTCFYDWMDYFNERFQDDLNQMKADLESVNKHAALANYGPLAIYPASYKTAHSCQYIFSYLAKPGTVRSVYEDDKAFFNYADLPYICRHPITRGPFMAANIFLEYPHAIIHPEIYTPNTRGLCPDAAVARAWPKMDWGENTPFPVDLTLKRTLEYVYGAVYHDGKSFRYWEKRGFHARTWERERFAGFLKLWGFIDKHTPVRPAGKVCAFLCSEECCRAHKLNYDEYGERDVYTPFGDLFNTAEETPAYAYEMSRVAGMNSGAVINLKSLKGLKGKEIDVLVLPPLAGASKNDLAEIRRLHKEGVALFGFEDVTGLEDLFGVKSGKTTQIHEIKVNQKEAVLKELAGMTEYTEHKAAQGKYRANGAKVLLSAEIPVLFTHTTEYGKTALYNLPPTVVRRQDQYNRVGMGRDNISSLINTATRLVLLDLSCGDIRTDAGKLIAFEDNNKAFHVIVEEDAHPLPAEIIDPVITIRNKDLRNCEITSATAFSVLEKNKNGAKIRLHLEQDQFAILSFTRK